MPQQFDTIPPLMLKAGMDKLLKKEHFWVATLVIEVSDEILAQEVIELGSGTVHAHSISCMNCQMPFKKGRQGRICQGHGGGPVV